MLSFLRSARRAAARLLPFLLASLAPAVQPDQRAPTPDWTRPVDLASLPATPPPRISSGLWHLYHSEQINRATDQIYFHRAYKIVNRTGIEEGSTISLSFEPNYQSFAFNALFVHRDGQRLDRLDEQQIEILRSESSREQLIYDNETEALLILNDLREGDIVEYAYTIAGSNPVNQGHFERSFSTSWSVPLARQHFLLLCPADQPLHFKHHGDPIELRSTRNGDSVAYEWLQDQPPIVLLEDALPDWFNPWRATEVSTFESWNQVALWGAALYSSEDALGPELEAVLATLRDLPTPEEQILATLRFVQDNIRYTSISIGEHNYKPYPLAEVYRRRFGDCKDKSRLLATLLRQLGFDATPALVNSYYGPVLDQNLPGPGNFDHVITRLRHNGATYWLDPTRSFQRGDLHTLFAENYGFALPLDREATALVWTGGANFDRSRTLVEERYEELGSNRALLRVSSTFEGADADRIRSQLNSTNPADLERVYLNHYATYFPDIESAAPPEIQDDEAANRVSITESYRIDSFLTPASGEEDSSARYATFHASTLSGLYSQPSDKIRSMPIRQAHPVNVQHTIHVDFLLDKWNFDNESRALRNPAFNYTFDVAAAPRSLRIQHSLQSLADHVSTKETRKYIADADALADFLSYSIVDQGSDALDAPDGSPIFFSHLSAAAATAVFTLPYAIILAWRPRRRNLPHDDPAQYDNLYGIGGWLVLVIIGIFIRGLFHIGYFLDLGEPITADNWQAIADPSSEHFNPNFIAILFGEPISTALQFTLCVALVILFFRQNRLFPRLYLLHLAYNAALVVATALLAIASNLYEPAEIDEFRSDAALTLFSTALWITYTLRSRRVRRTFIH